MSTGIIKRQPIHHFAMRGDLESIKLLLDRGVDIEARSADEDEQITALDTAAFFGKMETVEFLLERGAKPTERTMKNACRFDTNPVEIISLLHHHGGIVSAEMFLRFPKESKSWQPVHFAAAFGDAAMLKAVIDAGGNPKAKTLGGKTPLQLAEEFNQEGSVRFLKTLK
jgi:ankyrin repeat protein